MRLWKRLKLELRNIRKGDKDRVFFGLKIRLSVFDLKIPQAQLGFKSFEINSRYRLYTDQANCLVGSNLPGWKAFPGG